MTSHVSISVSGALGRITLNRPEAINALSREMIDAIAATLTGWALDHSIGAVVIDGAGPKGFCAGGDVRAARAMVLAGEAKAADAYFAAEYRMNALIASYRKPLVALTHGVVMGGGIGIAGHCSFRLTVPGARFAMPESAIGFFADVGVNAVLAKAPLNRALLFLLSGVTVGAADAVDLGLVDGVVAADRREALLADLSVAAGDSRPIDAIGRVIAAEMIEAGPADFCARADQMAAAPRDLASFLASIAAVPALADVDAALRGRCPASLAATWLAQLAARRHMDIHRTLAGDLRLASLMARRADFAEGVRAVLVDKDQRPVWSPATLAELDFAPFKSALETA